MPNTITRRTVLTGMVGALAVAAIPTACTAATPMMFADTSTGKPFSKDPSVVYFGGRYLMYFTAPPMPGTTRWRQMVAASTDLYSWRTLAEVRPAGDVEAKGICAGGAIVLGDKVHLFFQTYGNGAKDAICHAVSADGVTFTRNPGNPIIRPAGTWTSGRAIDAEPMVVGDQLFCYWATRDPSMTVQMVGGHSTPLTGLASTFAGARWYLRNGGPMLKPAHSWEGKCIEAASVIKRGDTYIMFYAGNYRPQQIGVAFSTNGVSWRRMSSQPFLRYGQPGSWNACDSGHPCVFRDPRDGATWLFYQGSNDLGRTWCISRRRIRWDGHIPRLG